MYLVENQPKISLGNGEFTQWIEQLFEPNDILEIRCLPPKELVDDHAPKKFAWGRFCQQIGFVPWGTTAEIASTFTNLQSFNRSAGISTPWVTSKGQVELRTVRLNVYVSANPRKSKGGTKNNDVALARSLFADFDNVNLDDVEQRITKANLPEPTLTVSSGHGFHAYWRLDEPIDDLNVWKRFQKRLIQAVGSDPSIHDPARVMRVPGFYNVNGSAIPVSLMNSTSMNRYASDYFDSVLPAHNPWKPKNRTSRPEIVSESFVVPTVTDDDSSEMFQRAMAYQSAIEPPSKGKRNSKIFEVACAISQIFKLNLNEVQAVIERFNSRFEDPLPSAELTEVINKAFKHVQTKQTIEDTHDIPDITKPIAPTRSLDDWRNEMKANRLETLNKTGIFFDGSPTGAGKSTADLVLMKTDKRTLTLVPTHQAGQELVQSLKTQGIKDVAAFPKLDETTCQQFGNKRSRGDGLISQNAGLDIGTAVCPDCCFYKHCRYQNEREAARKAKHAVATHARAAHTDFAIANDTDILLIHEDCRDLLRPTSKIEQNDIHRLKDVLTIAWQAWEIAIMMKDDTKETFAETLIDAVDQLITVLTNDELKRQVIEAEADGNLAEAKRVQSLPLRPKMLRPNRLDHLLLRAIKDTRIDPQGTVLRFCINYALGELASLALIVDDIFIRKGEREFSQCIVGVRRIDLPEDKLIWLEDATADAKVISSLIKRPVEDKTPKGTLAFEVPPLQYPYSDVTLQTSGNVLRGIVRSLLTKYSTCKKVGIITHQKHVQQINKIGTFWQERISRVDYFRSGNDRASNAWLSCDLLLILGTPRVPPSAVRQGLIQIGMIEEASKDGLWQTFHWNGVTTSGKIINIKGSGYKNPSWAKVHHMLVRSLLLQAIGRGRGVTLQGIPVVVVSNENLGLPFNVKLPHIKDSEAKTLLALKELSDIIPTINIVANMSVSSSKVTSVALTTKKLSDINATNTTVANMSVSTAEVAAQAGITERHAHRQLLLLSSMGLLTLKGQRGGWILNNDLL